MLISRSRRVLFVHVQKTGGSSIARVLADALPDLEQFKAKHAFISAGYAELPEPERWFKFAFVRNPWDRLVSWYSMIEQARHIHWLETLFDRRKRKHYRQARDNPLWRQVYDDSTDFPSFVRNCTAPVQVAPGTTYSFAYNQVDYLGDGSGRLLVDFVGRFENWTVDTAAVCERIGIRVDKWPRQNPSRHRHYSSYYDAETAAIVAGRFARDIAAFGYRMDSNG
jgi:hypothetical protein